MPYASVADLRAEGVPSTVANGRLEYALDEVSALIDRVCGWWFEPRTMTLTVSGRGLRSLTLRIPPIEVTGLEVNGEEYSVDPADLKIIGDPLAGPPCTLHHRVVIREGRDNVLVTGGFGFIERDALGVARTPRAVRRACILLALDRLPLITSAESDAARDQWRVVEEQTRDQRVRYSERSGAAGSLTGNLDADQLLAAYVRPPQFGAA